MHLTRALAHDATTSIRTRGAEYFDSGAVVHFDPQESFVYAVVRGGDDYVVRLEVDGREIRGTCTCPFFTDRLEPCKHLWAVAVACDARGVLQLPDTVRPDAIDFLPVPLDADAGGRDVDDPEFRLPRRPRGLPVAGARAEGSARWQQALAEIAASASRTVERPAASAGQFLYVIDLAASRLAGTLVTHLLRQEQKQNGDWGVLKPARLAGADLSALVEPDRGILERLAGGRAASPWSSSGVGVELGSPFHLRGAVARDLLPAICATGRCRLSLSTFPSDRPQSFPLVPLEWDERPVTFTLRVTRDEEAGAFAIEGALTRGDEVLPLTALRLLLEDGLALTEAQACVIDAAGLLPWLRQLLDTGPLHVPIAHAVRLRQTLLESGAAAVAGLPAELQTRLVETAPTPHLTLRAQRDARQFTAMLGFSYAGGPAIPAASSALAPTQDPAVLASRAHDVERAAELRLRALGVRASWSAWERRQVLQAAAADLPRIVHTLVSEGWQVDADGQRFRLAAGPPALEVRSGIDWFELHGEVRFDEQRVALPALLDAITHRGGRIALADGSVGIVPDTWLKQIGALGIGTKRGDHLRFTRSQVALLDALLAERPTVSWDATAAAIRERLSRVTVRAEDPPPRFTGTLREYQREALGWLAFLRELGFGGCLADDMGLGKTVVVLALLESRRQRAVDGAASRRPSLVVVPRSVLFNWQQEAARFAPELRVLDLSGAGRRGRMGQVEESDLVLVTYGTLRRDASLLAAVTFDYAILDEAQTIKNAQTAGAKAARLLNADHRLALSGTPVENRLADLWSLFEFLNPGLLSGSTAFARAFSGEVEAGELRALGRGLRPFILRRTKEQVASELPLKTEQTILCDLERPQRALYNELRDHYRRRLLGTTSWERSKIQVLEALLRLRQAACHPGLIDPSRERDSSAKLDFLVPRLIETIEEGHKALVFSQFTSFLALLRARLRDSGISYEYLDGRTRDREARVMRFQGDPDCRLFLISLKAGGVGLNLTAADYVFILDPWWNPAAEAQAVDRTHRIGQTRSVFAYRLIARDTVEERVLELQQRKRELADAIITADNSVVRSLRREDLELLLS